MLVEPRNKMIIRLLTKNNTEFEVTEKPDGSLMIYRVNPNYTRII